MATFIKVNEHLINSRHMPTFQEIYVNVDFIRSIKPLNHLGYDYKTVIHMIADSMNDDYHIKPLYVLEDVSDIWEQIKIGGVLGGEKNERL